MEKATICEYPHSYNALPHWRCVLRYCDKFICVNIPDQEKYDKYSNTSASILFHIYHLISSCKTNGRLQLNDKKFCCRCKQDYDP